MPYVVTLIGFVPPARYDGVAWTRARIYEGAVPAGPFVQIDDQPLNPVDADPTKPQARNLTTALAQLPIGWYQVVFFDAGGAQSEPSDPQRFGGDGLLPPSPDDIRNLSPLLRKKYPVPPTDPYAVADLRNVVYQATALVQEITWRLIDPTLGDLAPEDYTSEAVPDGMAPIAIQAITRMSERLKVTTDPALAEQIATGRRLRGFNAGPYSESYFAPGEFARRGAQQGRQPVDQDDALDAALWALMTEDARDYFVWRSTGQAPPLGSVTSFDYRRETIGYGAGDIGLPGGYGHGGPDGL